MSQLSPSDRPEKAANGASDLFISMIKGRSGRGLSSLPGEGLWWTTHLTTLNRRFAQGAASRCSSIGRSSSNLSP